MTIRVRQDDFWGEVAYVGKDKGVPKTYNPPLGENWDGAMDLSYGLKKAAGSLKEPLYGVVKKGNRYSGK